MYWEKARKQLFRLLCHFCKEESWNSQKKFEKSMPSREFDDKMKENNNNTTIIMEGKFARIEMNATTKKIRSGVIVKVYCSNCYIV